MYTPITKNHQLNLLQPVGISSGQPAALPAKTAPMKLLLIVWLTLALALLSAFAGAQEVAETDDEPTVVRPVQVTLVPPLGTNGLEAGKCTNHVSINVFGGYSKGLHGAEIGGFVNVLSGDMVGAQAAGFGNTVVGASKGVQASGFYNITRGHLHGAQLGGFANVGGNGMKGAQFGGFANVMRGATHGAQFAGFGNLATNDMVGGQVGGFVNVLTGNLHGLQAAGYANVAIGDVRGVQLAGFANVANNVRGSQIAGFINVARRVTGLQIGFINIADSVDGVPIGFFNFVRKGYRAVEVYGHETLFANVALKSGTERFYNILTLGYRPGPHGPIWAYGYGLGTRFAVNETFTANVDVTCSQLNDGEWHTNALNLLNKAQLNLGWQLNEQLEMFGGASLNLHVSNRENGERDFIGSDAIPWSVSDWQTREALWRMYPGFQFGIRF